MSTISEVELEGLVRTDTRVQFGIPIGVDAGRWNLLTLAPATAGLETEEAFVADGLPIVEGYMPCCSAS